MSRKRLRTGWLDRVCGPDLVGHNRANLLSSAAFVDRLELRTKLEIHDGCVNTVAWSDDGKWLLSGSDDCSIALWNTRHHRLDRLIRTCHYGNIFATAFVPESGNRQLVSCAADGELLLHEVEQSSTDRTGQSSGDQLHQAEHFLLKLAFHPSHPSLLAVSGRETLLCDLREKKSELSSITCGGTDGCPAASTGIAFDPRNPNTLAIGVDDPVVRLYDIRMCVTQRASAGRSRCSQPCSRLLRQFCPVAAAQTHRGLAGIFRILPGFRDSCGVSSLQFSTKYPGRLLANYRNGDVFEIDTLQYNPVETASGGIVSPEYVTRFSGRVNVDTFAKDAIFMGDDEWVVTGGDCGHLFIWNRKSGKLTHKHRGDRCVVNSVASHPSLPTLAVSGIDCDVKLFECGDPATTAVERRARRRIESVSATESLQDGERDSSVAVTTDTEALVAALGESSSATSVSVPDVVADDSREESEPEWSDDSSNWSEEEAAAEHPSSELAPWLRHRPRSFGERMRHNPDLLTAAEARNRIASAQSYATRGDECFRDRDFSAAREHFFSALRALEYLGYCAEDEECRAQLEVHVLLKQARTYFGLQEWSLAEAAARCVVQRLDLPDDESLLRSVDGRASLIEEATAISRAAANQSPTGVPNLDAGSSSGFASSAS